MKFSVEIDEVYCEVNFYHLSDDCDPDDRLCSTWMGYFAYEVVGTSATVFSWNIEHYDTRALRAAVNYFITNFCKPNSIQTIFVERSRGDRVWDLLGWEMVDKCSMLERAATLCT